MAVLTRNSGHFESEPNNTKGQKKPDPSSIEKVTAAISVEASHDAEVERHLTPDQARQLDQRQSELMSAHSPEGQPPEHTLLNVEWKGLRYVIGSMVLAALIWVVARGVDGSTVLMGVAFVFILVFAAAPAWGAALMRGREERAARSAALHEIKPTTGDYQSTDSFDQDPDCDTRVVVVKEESREQEPAGEVH